MMKKVLVYLVAVLVCFAFNSGVLAQQTPVKTAEPPTATKIEKAKPAQKKATKKPKKAKKAKKPTSKKVQPPTTPAEKPTPAPVKK